MIERALSFQHQCFRNTDAVDPSCGVAEIGEARLETLSLCEDLGLDFVKYLVLGSFYFLENGLPKCVCAERLPSSQQATMVGEGALSGLLMLAEDVLARGVLGDFISTGSWRGGTMAAVAALLRLRNVQGRTVHLADSFMPLAAARDIPPSRTTALLAFNSFGVVRTIYDRLGLLSGFNTTFVATVGSVATELQRRPQLFARGVALANIESERYDDVLGALCSIHPAVSEGGIVVVMSFYRSGAAQRAVQAYRDAQPITSL